MTDLMLKRQTIINDEFLSPLYDLISKSGHGDHFVYNAWTGCDDVIGLLMSEARAESVVFFMNAYHITAHHVLGAMRADLRFVDVTDTSCRIIPMDRFNALYP